MQVLGLKTILLALGKIATLASLHQASWPLMFYAVECMRPTVYEQSTALLSNMKQQLSDCNMGRVRNFSFGSILSTFFFERVPGISPRVDIPPHGVRDPSQQHLENVMHRLGGVRVANPYPIDFFPWQWRQIIAINDYPHAGIDFHRDSDMPLPLGAAYGQIGKESQTHFLSFELFNFFFCFLIY